MDFGQAFNFKVTKPSYRHKNISQCGVAGLKSICLRVAATKAFDAHWIASNAIKNYLHFVSGHTRSNSRIQSSLIAFLKWFLITFLGLHGRGMVKRCRRRPKYQIGNFPMHFVLLAIHVRQRVTLRCHLRSIQLVHPSQNTFIKICNINLCARVKCEQVFHCIPRIINWISSILCGNNWLKPVEAERRSQSKNFISVTAIHFSSTPSKT